MALQESLLSISGNDAEFLALKSSIQPAKTSRSRSRASQTVSLPAEVQILAGVNNALEADLNAANAASETVESEIRELEDQINSVSGELERVQQSAGSDLARKLLHELTDVAHKEPSGQVYHRLNRTRAEFRAEIDAADRYDAKLQEYYRGIKTRVDATEALANVIREKIDELKRVVATQNDVEDDNELRAFAKQYELSRTWVNKVTGTGRRLESNPSQRLRRSRARGRDRERSEPDSRNGRNGDRRERDRERERERDRDRERERERQRQRERERERERERDRRDGRDRRDRDRRDGDRRDGDRRDGDRRDGDRRDGQRRDRRDRFRRDRFRR